MEVLIIDNIEAKMKGKMVPIWEKYMLTAAQYKKYKKLFKGKGQEKKVVLKKYSGK